MRIIIATGLAFWSMAVVAAAVAADIAPTRRVVSLDGVWQVEQGSMVSLPKELSHTIVVPGLLDMARPAFAEVGMKSKLRDAFWYRRTFSVDGAVPEVALLKIRKAAWGAKVFLNGQLLGEHLACFTPAIWNVKPYLKGNGQPNELVIRIGADRTAIPKGMPNAWDFEKYRFIPGIFDSVELILTGSPYVINVQTAPDLPKQSVRVVAEIQADKASETAVSIEICEAASGKAVASVQSPKLQWNRGQPSKVDVSIAIPQARLWSPEDPFLYVAKVSTSADSLCTRFGMRSFGADPKTGRMVLNGKPYYMRGTNVTAYRFFEDASRGDLPWRADWVRKLHRKYKSMHWNSIRYCIGFPPDFWYDIADEEGFLIQDEFPIWLGDGKPERPGDGPDNPTAEHIIPQYTAWMRERWNHPCVVIWDAQNESFTLETGKAIAAVRHLDLSNRPWENGYEEAQCPTDCAESHPYQFSRNYNADKGHFLLKELATTSPVPWLTEQQRRKSVPVIINEYDWLWLNRDGSPTCLTEKVYKGLLGPNSTVEQRRMLHARYVAALTEFWRCNRKAAGVLHFCELGYSRPSNKPRPEGGATCDDFLDIEKLVLEPQFERYVRDAFAPLGIMVDFWADKITADSDAKFPVVVINDLYDDWQGNVRLKLFRDDKLVKEVTQTVKVPSLGRQSLAFTVHIPRQTGHYRVEASVPVPNAPPTQSLRDFEVVR